MVKYGKVICGWLNLKEMSLWMQEFALSLRKIKVWREMARQEID